MERCTQRAATKATTRAYGYPFPWDSYESQHKANTRGMLTHVPIQELRLDISPDDTRIRDLARGKFLTKICNPEKEELAPGSIVFSYVHSGSPKSLKIYLTLTEKPREFRLPLMVDLSQLHCLSHIVQSLDRSEMVVDSYEMDKRDSPYL
jgi:hypothetical protein